MKILLIDDNLEYLTDLYTTLDFYHQCDMYTVPEEAIATYRKHRYDVVIADINMPGMDRIEVLSRCGRLIQRLM